MAKKKIVVAETKVVKPAKPLPYAVVLRNQKQRNDERNAKLASGYYAEVNEQQLKEEQNGSDQD